MVTYSTIRKNELECTNRLDAEYYQPEYLEWLKQLSKFNLRPLNELTTKIDVGFVSSMTSHFQDTGVPLLRTQNVKEFFVDLESDVVYIDEEFHKKLKKTQVFPGYVLLARSGTIGNACIIPEGFPIANSADIILMKTSDDIVPEYLATFLNSKYGRFQVDRASSGGLQGHLNLFSLEQLLILTANREAQECIKKIVLSGLSELENSRSLYIQAEDLLLEELGLKDYRPEEPLGYVVNFSDVKAANRIDADYFQPKYDELIGLIKKYGAKNLLEVAENVPARFNPVGKPDETFRYIELANINSSLGIIDGFSEVLGKEAPSRAKRILKENDIVASSIGGSLDKIALVGRENEGSLASTGFFQFRSRGVLPEVLLVLSKSPILQMQFEKEVSGTILAAIPNEALRNMIVPDLPQEIQQKIADLVRQSHEARKKSKELLEEAKRKVEEMIEKGGE